jgi:murein DD-endopeptidase MepM/ murein hydrolase activator NlpD
MEMTNRHLWTLGALASLSIVSCFKFEDSKSTDSTRAAATRTTDSTIADTLVGLATTSDSLPPVAITPMSSEIRGPAVPPMPTSGPAPKPAADTGIGVATSLELQQLRAVLDVPVQGVPRSALRDNYTEPRAGHTHEAEDIIAPRGTPVLSATDGRVTKLHESVAGGHMIYAGDASDRWILMYGHLERYADGVKEGMPLKRGQLIGYVGTSGNAPIATPHLHFAVARGTPSVKWWKGTPVNPYLLLKP